MKTTLTILAMVSASLILAQRPLPRTDDQNQKVKRGVFVRAGIIGAAGVCVSQFGRGTTRDAGWAMVACSAVSIFAVQIVIGDRVSDEAKRRRIQFLKIPY